MHNCWRYAANQRGTPRLPNLLAGCSERNLQLGWNPRIRYGYAMPFVVQAHTDDHSISVTTATAKEAFAKALEWHVSGQFTRVCILDDIKTYSLDAFSLAMALLEIAKTLGATAELNGQGK